MAGCCDTCFVGFARWTIFVLCFLDCFYGLLGVLGLHSIDTSYGMLDQTALNIQIWFASLFLAVRGLLGCFASFYKDPKGLKWFIYVNLALATLTLVGLTGVVSSSSNSRGTGEAIFVLVLTSIYCGFMALLAYVLRRYSRQPEPASAPANSIVTQELGTNPDATNLAQLQTVHQSQPPLNPNYRPSVEAKGMLTNPSDGQQESLRYSDRPPSYNSAQ